MDIVAYLLGFNAAKGSASIGIFKQPVDATVAEGENAEITIVALGENLSYQWQYSADGGTTWTNSSYASATESTLSFTANKVYNGYLYRCIVTNASGSITSLPVTLTVYTELTITTQPQSVTATLGDTVTFTIVAVGEGALTYQWQWYYNGWRNTTVSGNKTDTITMEATEERNGNRYRCVITDSRTTVTSDEATLTVTE